MSIKKNPMIKIAIFEVPGNMTSISYGQDVYPVVNHMVELPADQDWYQDMVKAGNLIFVTYVEEPMFDPESDDVQEG